MMRIHWLGLLVLVLAVRSASAITPNKFLFDATKAEMAGNADWVVDADVHNIGTGAGGAMIVGQGNESNPQQIPTPPASGITASTPETYWTGALSSWGVALVKNGMQVETLPYNGRITYNDGTNAQDLSHYSVYVVDEPNIKFTASEKTAILNFVHDGGGLFMIADHTGSDRNNDGFDSLQIWNDLMQNNGVVSNPFGITFNSDNVSPLSTNVDTTPSDPIIHGPGGNVAEMQYNNGCTITIAPAANASVQIAIWTSASHTNSNGMVAFGTYGQGRVVALGDSSPFDDGTGDPNDGLFTGWSGDANGDHARLGINASIWLNDASACTPPAVNPISDTSTTCGINFSSASPTTSAGTGPITWSLGAGAPSGMTINASTGFVSWPTPLTTGSPFTIVSTATNSCGNSSATWHLAVNPNPPSVSASNASAVCGVSYTSAVPTTSGGVAPLSWTLVSGPSGMTVNSSTGAVTWPNPASSGLPFTISVQASSDDGCGSSSQSWQLSVTRGDFDADGLVTEGDIPGFVNDLLLDPPSQICAGDLNGDGLVDGDDILEFTRSLGL